MSRWHLSFDGYEPDEQGLREALCTTGNGYFCTRGAVTDSGSREGRAARPGVHYPGTYLAGGYNRTSATVAGREVENEDLVNLPDWLPLTIAIADGPWFRIDAATVRDYRQELDLREGVLSRRFRFTDAAGHSTLWEERRFVSMDHSHLGALQVTLTPVDWSGPLRIRSAIDGGVINDGVERYRDLTGRHLEVLEIAHPPAPEGRDGACLAALRARTLQSRLEVAVVISTRVHAADGTPLPAAISRDDSEVEAVLLLEVEAREAAPITVEKRVALHSSRDYAISEPLEAGIRLLDDTPPFEALLEAHRRAWQQLWDDFDIGLEAETDSCGAPEGNSEAEMKLRLHTFHLLQTVSEHTTEMDVGVPARGWHGEAYRGHIFWDELFIFPFLNLRRPALTHALLLYRYRRLPEARRAAREAGHSGALFPWQSGASGREESQRLHLNPESGRWLPDNTHRQWHINAAVAYNIWHYWEVTQDHSFLHAEGAEMMLEIARFWASVATHDPEDDRYDIRGVMGPDEYHDAYPDVDPEQEGGLDNNAYTNVMVAWLMSRAVDVWELMPAGERDALCDRLGIGSEDRDHWETLSRRLRIPFHEDPDGQPVISQFEGYGELEELDWEHYGRKYGLNMRLDRILEAEGDSPNRYRASKQADVLMLFYLFTAEELQLIFEKLGYRFDPDLIPRNVDYYLRRTSHGSTLSFVSHAWVLARSDREHAWRLFCMVLDSDVEDLQGGTTPEGIHTGAMAGSIDIVQRCFLGIETREDILHLDPVLPDGVRRLRARLYYRRHILDVEADHETLRVHSAVLPAPPIHIAYRGHIRVVGPGMDFAMPLVKPWAHPADPEERRRQRERRERRERIEAAAPSARGSDN